MICSFFIDFVLFYGKGVFEVSSTSLCYYLFKNVSPDSHCGDQRSSSHPFCLPKRNCFICWHWSEELVGENTLATFFDNSFIWKDSFLSKIPIVFYYSYQKEKNDVSLKYQTIFLGKSRTYVQFFISAKVMVQKIWNSVNIILIIVAIFQNFYRFLAK